jgi:hypothetical protein
LSLFVLALELLVVLFEDLVHLGLLLLPVLLYLVVETVDLVALLQVRGQLLPLELHLLQLAVFLVEQLSQLSDFIVFAAYDLVLLLVDQVPVLVLLNYELLELLVLHLLLLERLRVFLDLHPQFVPAFHDRRLVLFQFFELPFDVVPSFHLLVQGNDYRP